MKRLGLFLWLLIFLLPMLHGQKTRYGQGLPKAKVGVDYPLTLHVSANRVRTECQGENNCASVLYADATVNGKKIELASDFGLYMEFSRDIKEPLLGDFRARIVSNDPGKMPNTIGLKYEILLHDNSVLACSVTGVLE